MKFTTSDLKAIKAAIKETDITVTETIESADVITLAFRSSEMAKKMHKALTTGKLLREAHNIGLQLRTDPKGEEKYRHFVDIFDIRL